MAEQQTNSNTKIVDALSAHLENASVPSKIPVPAGTIAASTLETQLIVAALKKQVRDLINAQTSNSGNNSGNNHSNRRNSRNSSGRGRGKRGGKRQTPPPSRTERRWTNQNYCWIHGCDMDDEHTSATC